MKERPAKYALNDALALAIIKLEEAKADVLETAKAVAASCPHNVVLECKWQAGYWLGPNNPRRICTSCGYEEEGSHWSGGAVWSRVDFGTAMLGNSDSRFVMPIERDEFYSYRIPGTPVNSAEMFVKKSDV